MDEIVCTGCGAEPAEEQTREELQLDGWSLDGEFGESCPECVANAVNPEGTAGLDAVAEALGVTKKDEHVPEGIQFSQQVCDSSGFGGCVDYDPDYKGPIPPPVEEPKPDVWVKMAPPKKEGSE